MQIGIRRSGEYKSHICNTQLCNKKNTFTNLETSENNGVFFPNSNVLKALYIQNNKTSENNFSVGELTEEDRQKLNASSLDKKTIMQLIRLMEKGYVDSNIFKNIPANCEFSQNILDDIELFNVAKETDIPIEDVYVPEYSSKKEMYKNGDLNNEVCSINGRIYCKNDNTYIPIKMDKETYIKLFPPIKRFSSNQQKNGDCYLVAALANIYNNPSTRIKILKCFKQDGNDIKVKLPNSKEVYTIKNGKLNDSQLGDKQQFAEGADWLKILEYVYGLESRESFVQNSKYKTFEMLDKAYLKKIQNEEKIAETQAKIDSIDLLKQDLEMYKKIPEKDEFVNKKIEMLEKRIEALNEPLLAMNLELYNYCQVSLDLIFDENIKNKEILFEAINNLDDFWIKKGNSTQMQLDYFQNVKEIVKDVVFSITGVQVIEDEQQLENLKQRYKTNTNFYREGGNVAEAYFKLGMPVRIFNTDKFSSSFYKENFYNYVCEKANNGGIFAAATKANITSDFDKNIRGTHAYYFEPVFSENYDLDYYIINPSNTAIKTKITEKELLENFDSLAVITK